MQKRVYYFEINMDAINKSNETKYLKLYPKYIAKNVIFLNSGSTLDSFYFINEESYILEFIEELKFLNIHYILSDVTSDFLNEKLDLNPDQFKQLKNLFY